MSKTEHHDPLEGLMNRNEELTSQLYHVNERLKEAEAFKSHFISNMTNEIINPFASILALSSNIVKLGEGEITKAKKMAALIHDEAFHLDFQLKNIFAAAQIEAGLDELMPVTVDLVGVGQSAIRFFETEAEKKQLEIIFSVEQEKELKSFYTDGDKIELILRNLLSNAIKFSDLGGKVQVALSVREHRFKIDVRDFGKGILPEQYKVIFDRFKQLDTKINSLNTGQGLGLSIVYAYVQSFDGEISLNSPEDGGLEIQVIIPECNKIEGSDDLDGFLLDSGEKF